MCVRVLQVDSEMGMSELMLSNATRRLLDLKRNEGALRQKTRETSNSAELAQNKADYTSEDTEQTERVTWPPVTETWMEGRSQVEAKEEEKQSLELHNS